MPRRSAARRTSSRTGSPITSPIPDAIPFSRRFDRARSATRFPARRRSTASRSTSIFSDFERVILPGHHALEPSRLLRLLRDHRQRTRRPRGIPVGGAQRPGDALADLAVSDRARGGRARMAATADWDCPTSFEGVIYDTASISTLHALAAAREAGVRGVRTLGLAGRSDLPRASRLLFRARALVGRQGGDPARPRPRRAATRFRQTAISVCGPTRCRTPSRTIVARAGCRSR